MPTLVGADLGKNVSQNNAPSSTTPWSQSML
jgi:hypothetical protein